MRTIPLTYAVLFLFPILMTVGCKHSTSHDSEQVHGSGTLVTSTRAVDACDGIAITSFGSVILTQAETQSIRIEADDNIMSTVIVEKKNGVLVVGLPSGSYSDVTLRVYVSMKNISSLSISGAGSIDCAASITAPSLACTITGAGMITVRGTGNDLACTVNGAGTIGAKDFTARNCTAILSGAGTCTVFASEMIDATVSGVGTITYFGNPATVRTSVSGIGQVSRGS